MSQQFAFHLVGTSFGDGVFPRWKYLATSGMSKYRELVSLWRTDIDTSVPSPVQVWIGVSLSGTSALPHRCVSWKVTRTRCTSWPSVGTGPFLHLEGVTTVSSSGTPATLRRPLRASIHQNGKLELLYHRKKREGGKLDYR